MRVRRCERAVPRSPSAPAARRGRSRSRAGMLAELLAAAGYEVDVARDGQAALHLALNGRHDVAVFDRGLPHVEGLELLSRLRGAGWATPVVILSAYAALEDRVAGLDAGAEDYLVKPFDVEELLARLRALLRRHLAQADLLVVPGGRFDAGARIVTRDPATAGTAAAPVVELSGAGGGSARGAGPAARAGVPAGRAPGPRVPRRGGRQHRRHLRALPAPQARPGGGAHGARRRLPARRSSPATARPGDGAGRPPAAWRTGRHPTPTSSLVRRAGRRAAWLAAALVAVSFLVCAGLVLLIVVTGQDRAARSELAAAVARADDVSDPPAGISLLLRRPDGGIEVTPGAPAVLPYRPGISAVLGAGAPAVQERGRRPAGRATSASGPSAGPCRRRPRSCRPPRRCAPQEDERARRLRRAGRRRRRRPPGGRRARRRHRAADGPRAGGGAAPAAAVRLRRQPRAAHPAGRAVHPRPAAPAAPGRGAWTTTPGGRSTADADRLLADSARLADVVEDLLAASEPRAPATECVDLRAVGRRRGGRSRSARRGPAGGPRADRSGGGAPERSGGPSRSGRRAAPCAAAWSRSSTTRSATPRPGARCASAAGCAGARAVVTVSDAGPRHPRPGAGAAVRPLRLR